VAEANRVEEATPLEGAATQEVAAALEGIFSAKVQDVVEVTTTPIATTTTTQGRHLMENCSVSNKLVWGGH